MLAGCPSRAVRVPARALSVACPRAPISHACLRVPAPNERAERSCLGAVRHRTVSGDIMKLKILARSI